MKRNLSSNDYYPIAKRTRYNLAQPQLFISATHTRNYMLNDSLVDWIKMKKCKAGRTSRKDNNFTSFIMNKGCEFEDEVVKYLKRRIPVVTVSTKITIESLAETIKLMKNGTPVIHSAPVRNLEDGTQGIIDLLVRSDYLHLIVNECPLTGSEKKIKSPILNTNYHYLVIDIKFSTLALRSDGRHLLNSGSYSAYKAQCLIYTNAVGLIQGYTSNYAYILGRRWTSTSKGMTNRCLICNDRLGVIDYSTVDNDYIKKTKDAINWVRDLRKNGENWSVNPPSRKELYPNMCVRGDFDAEKKAIANELNDITNIWYCGVKSRDKAFTNGVKRWNDVKCTSKILGMSGKRGETIDKMLNINRQDKLKFLPAVISNNLHSWKDTNCNEVYVDFEMFTDLFSSFDNLPRQEKTDMMFMIGVYYRSKAKAGKAKAGKAKADWKYKSFVITKITYEEEFRIMNEFSTFIKALGYPKLWYWYAEKSTWKTAENRQYERSKSGTIVEWDKLNWVDLMDVMKKEPVVLKDCFSFGLKDMSAAMRKHGFITTSMDSDCNNGLTAMIRAYEYFKKDVTERDDTIINDIITYNKFDCQVLWDLHRHIRAERM